MTGGVTVKAKKKRGKFHRERGEFRERKSGNRCSNPKRGGSGFFFLLDAAWVRSRAERPSVSYTKVTA